MLVLCRLLRVSSNTYSQLLTSSGFVTITYETDINDLPVGKAYAGWDIGFSACGGGLAKCEQVLQGGGASESGISVQLALGEHRQRKLQTALCLHCLTLALC